MADQQYFKSSVQISRPFLTSKAVKFLQKKTIPDYQTYKQRISHVLSFLLSLTRLLKFPSRTLESAMLYYQRYYLFNHFSTSSNIDVAIAALFIASKNEDTIKKLRDIIAIANPLRNAPNTNEAIEENKKVILNFEKKMLETISFDFRTYHIDELLIRIAKDLKLSVDLTYLAYMIAFDSFQTEVSLKTPQHATAIACIIIAAKFREENSVFPLNSAKYKCDRALVNEALFEILELYINNYNYGSLADMYPNDKESFIKIRINIKNEINLKDLDERSLLNDGFYNIKNYNVSDTGSARYMLGNQEKRFYEEVDAQENYKESTEPKKVKLH
ncbi:Ctk2 protein [Saccharomycopsis crataegensis]|uniref:Ctk2 protein n=1 Tax=Saccharomycopsis crataegensis TaxID=43959 RepID=A0AAV5QE53_9ASCO|nr:Ctk2 protein [Saccharomycopsis crataegensis]